VRKIEGANTALSSVAGSGGCGSDRRGKGQKVRKIEGANTALSSVAGSGGCGSDRRGRGQGARFGATQSRGVATRRHVVIGVETVVRLNLRVRR
jgi:hypothetical protein